MKQNDWDSGLKIAEPLDRGFKMFKRLMKATRFHEVLGAKTSYTIEFPGIYPRTNWILRGPWWQRDTDPLHVLRVFGVEDADAMLNVQVHYGDVIYAQVYVHKKGKPMWRGWRIQT